MSWVRNFVSRCLLLVVASACGPFAAAAPLDETICKTYDAQQKILESQGLKADVAKGPDWAKATLSAARIVLVKQYIYIKEQVAFRCPSLIVVSVPELAEPEAKHPQADAKAKAPGKATVKSKKKDKKRKKSADGSVPLPSQKATATQ